MKSQKENKVIIDVENDDWISEIDFTNANVVEVLARAYGVVLAGSDAENKVDMDLHEIG